MGRVVCQELLGAWVSKQLLPRSLARPRARCYAPCVLATRYDNRLRVCFHDRYGDNGFMLFAKGANTGGRKIFDGGNLCGIASCATYPLV